MDGQGRAKGQRAEQENERTRIDADGQPAGGGPQRADGGIERRRPAVRWEMALHRKAPARKRANSASRVSATRGGDLTLDDAQALTSVELELLAS